MLVLAVVVEAAAAVAVVVVVRAVAAERLKVQATAALRFHSLT